MAEILIEYRDVEISRQELTILKNINLRINKGEFIYLIGRVGSGKSSLMKSMYADIPLEKGDAEIFNYNLRKIKRKHIPFLRRKIGIVFQDFQLLTDRTVYSNLEFVLKATGWSRKEDIEERIDTVLKRVDMHTKGYKMPHQLSGGEQQRIVIARALLNNPEIILADEPTGNLDPETGANIVQILRDICASGTTIIMATHNHSLTKEYPGRVLCIEGNELIEINKQESNTVVRENFDNNNGVLLTNIEDKPESIDEVIGYAAANMESQTEESIDIAVIENPDSDENNDDIIENDESIVNSENNSVNYEINSDRIKPELSFSTEINNDEFPNNKMTLNDLYARNINQNNLFSNPEETKIDNIDTDKPESITKDTESADDVIISDKVESEVINTSVSTEDMKHDEEEAKEINSLNDQISNDDEDKPTLESDIVETVTELVSITETEIEVEEKYDYSLFDDLIDDAGYVLIDDDFDDVEQKGNNSKDV